jgi:hypothetical protein
MHAGYFEHLVAPGLIVEHYANDLSDLLLRAKQLLAEGATSTGQQRLKRLAEQQQALAHYHLNHVAVAAAMASAITQVSALSRWKVVSEQGYERVAWSKCCTHAKSLPAEFVAAVRARQAARHDVGRVAT